jgi:dynamin 1/3
MVQNSEGTWAIIALGLCREFEDKFLQHIAGGEVCHSPARRVQGEIPTKFLMLSLEPVPCLYIIGSIHIQSSNC